MSMKKIEQINLDCSAFDEYFHTTIFCSCFSFCTFPAKFIPDSWAMLSILSCVSNLRPIRHAKVAVHRISYLYLCFIRNWVHVDIHHHTFSNRIAQICQKIKLSWENIWKVLFCWPVCNFFGSVTHTTDVWSLRVKEIM